MIPQDPVMLLSYMNTQLRDHYPNLEAMAEDTDVDMSEVIRKLESIDYVYDPKKNQFV